MTLDKSKKRLICFNMNQRGKSKKQDERICKTDGLT